SEWSSSIGYSLVDIHNAFLQAPSAFHRGHYALANLLYYPVKNVMTGIEFQWGERQNFNDGFTFDDYRLQFAARYNFDFSLGGNKEISNPSPSPWWYPPPPIPPGRRHQRSLPALSPRSLLPPSRRNRRPSLRNLPPHSPREPKRIYWGQKRFRRMPTTACRPRARWKISNSPASPLITIPVS